MQLGAGSKRISLALAVGALLSIGCGLLLHRYHFGVWLIHSSYDLLLASRGDIAAREAVIVYLDEVSHDKLGQRPNAPWDRSLHARLIDRLTSAGARAIVFDVVFDKENPSDPTGDQRLVRAVKASGRVILAADNVTIAAKTKQMFPPFPALLDSAAGVGSAEVIADNDLIVRLHTPEDQLPALCWAAAQFLNAPATGEPGKNERWMNYYGAPNTIPSVSYYEALDPKLAGDDLFRGKVVFVGARLITKFAGERKDEYQSPFSFWLTRRMMAESRTLFVSGVEIQATACLNILRGDWLRRWSQAGETWVIVVLGLSAGVGLVLARPVWAVAFGLAGLALVAAGAYSLLRLNLTWFPWLILVVQISVACFWAILFNSIQLYVQKRLYEQTLALYLSPKLVKKFASHPEFLQPGAEEQSLTLFFSDIADFTTLTEGMNPDELAAMMNDYFEAAVHDCIHKTDGTVVKYIGDSVFTFWNAPDEQPDHALRACEAALHFRELARRPIRGRLLRTRIGMHTGTAKVGNFGSRERFDYTALGENVNMASRLEGLNKMLGTECLISGQTNAELGGKFVTRSLGKFRLKGFELVIEAFELVGFPDQAEATRPWREAFAEALANYEQRNLEFAEPGFRRVLELRPEDGPSKFYLNMIAEKTKAKLPPDWSTFTVVKEK